VRTPFLLHGCLLGDLITIRAMTRLLPDLQPRPFSLTFTRLSSYGDTGPLIELEAMAASRRFIGTQTWHRWRSQLIGIGVPSLVLDQVGTMLERQKIVTVGDVEIMPHDLHDIGMEED
jgi:hypothetical protein